MNSLQLIVVGALVVGMALSAAAAGGVVWQEGEDFVKATNTTRNNVADKPVASGGKSLYGPALDKKDLVVQYRFKLAEPIDAAQVIFRYSRLHWRETMVPAAIRMELAGPGEPITRELAFADTKGWGRKPADWRLLTAAAGPMAAGEWTLTLTSLANNNSINMDGFFVAAADFKVTAEELSALLRLQITSEGYLGFRARSAAIRQDQTKTLPMATRSFTGKRERQHEARIAKDKGKWVGLKLADGGLTTEDRLTYVANVALPPMPDGAYRLWLGSVNPTCQVEVPLTLLGDFMSTLDARLAKVEGFAAKLDADESPAAAACKADFEHAVEFLRAGRDTMTTSVAQPEGSAWKEHLAQHEGLSDPAPLAVNMETTLKQFEQTMERLQKSQNPYAGRTGQFRRAYRSSATKALRVYRSFVPTGYAKADKVTLILMLHGGGGNENTFHDMDDGAILKVLADRGYLMVAPKYHSRTQEKVVSDLLQLIDLTREQYPKIDPDRIYVTGISMGGFMSYRLATAHPDLFAAACCVSGTGATEQAKALKTTPLLILQGGADGVVPPKGAKAVAAKMKDLGYMCEIHIFEHHGHEYHAEQYIKLTLDYFDKAGAKKR